MPITHLLEDFTSLRTPVSSGHRMNEEELEEFRLGAFEQGYSAGWEDAVTAQSKERRRISAELARNLEDLSFTYHEAVNDLTLATEPVFRALTDRVLPETLSQQCGSRILEVLRTAVQEELRQPIHLAVSPGEGSVVRALLAENTPLSVEVHEVLGLEPGQAELRIGQSESRIDVARLIDTFREALDAFFFQARKESGHG